MEKTSELLIYLMACSLQSTKPEEALLANIDMEALLRLAKAHSVSAMVCMALEKTAIFASADEATKKHWLEAKICFWMPNEPAWKRSLHSAESGVCR